MYIYIYIYGVFGVCSRCTQLRSNRIGALNPERLARSQTYCQGLGGFRNSRKPKPKALNPKGPNAQTIKAQNVGYLWGHPRSQVLHSHVQTEAMSATPCLLVLVLQGEGERERERIRKLIPISSPTYPNNCTLIPCPTPRQAPVSSGTHFVKFYYNNEPDAGDPRLNITV